MNCIYCDKNASFSFKESEFERKVPLAWCDEHCPKETRPGFVSIPPELFGPLAFKDEWPKDFIIDLRAKK